ADEDGIGDACDEDSGGDEGEGEGDTGDGGDGGDEGGGEDDPGDGGEPGPTGLAKIASNATCPAPVDLPGLALRALGGQVLANVFGHCDYCGLRNPKAVADAQPLIAARLDAPFGERAGVSLSLHGVAMLPPGHVGFPLADPHDRLRSGEPHGVEISLLRNGLEIERARHFDPALQVHVTDDGRKLLLLRAERSWNGVGIRLNAGVKPLTHLELYAACIEDAPR